MSAIIPIVLITFLGLAYSATTTDALRNAFNVRTNIVFDMGLFTGAILGLASLGNDFANGRKRGWRR